LRGEHARAGHAGGRGDGSGRHDRRTHDGRRGRRLPRQPGARGRGRRVRRARARALSRAHGPDTGDLCLRGGGRRARRRRGGSAMSDQQSPRALTRRELLASALILPIAGAWPQRRSDELPTLPDIWKAPWRVVGGPGADKLIVTRQRASGQNFAASRVSNPTDRAVSVKEGVLCEVSLRLVPPDTLVYGEGFQMLTQTAGSVGNPVDAGSYTDAKHYRLPTATNTDGARTFYGMMKIGSVLEARNAAINPLAPWVLAFTSCRRFSGFFRFHGTAPLEVVVDTEGLTLGPGDSWDLEEFYWSINTPCMNMPVDSRT